MTGIAAGIMRGPGGTGDRALVTPVIRSGFDFGPAFQEKDGDGNSSRGGSGEKPFAGLKRKSCLSIDPCGARG